MSIRHLLFNDTVLPDPSQYGDADYSVLYAMIENVVDSVDDDDFTDREKLDILDYGLNNLVEWVAEIRWRIPLTDEESEAWQADFDERHGIVRDNESETA